jgi:GDP-L-fucose synthase
MLRLWMLYLLTIISCSSYGCCLLDAGEIPLDAKIYVAGHGGLVGQALMRKLQDEGYTSLITRTSKELDLRNQQAVLDFFKQEQPSYVIIAAAKVGGIKANIDRPADFIYDNLMIEANIIHAAYQQGVEKLLFLGSSCIYPRNCPQPIKESYLLTSELEWTNEAYAIAKIAGIKLCQSYNRQHGTRFITCMPTNLYGPYDNFDLATSHVLPALIRKFEDAKDQNLPSVTIWGSGTPRREFLHVDDLATAVLFLLRHYEGNDIVNVGCGEDVTIAGLAKIIGEEAGYQGELAFDTSYPDGTPQKLLDISKIRALGWEPSISLRQGIHDVIRWYRDSKGVSLKENK